MAPRSRASLSARFIALLRAEVDRPVVASGDPESEDRLIDTLRIVLPPPRLPGIRPYVAARTRFYDQALLRACESGATQVVIVAAGYDARALRFRQPGVRFFELDHPDTRADKLTRLTDLRVNVDDVSFVPVDLGHDEVAGALAEAGHDPSGATHFMAEGLTEYLPAEVLAGLLQALAKSAGPGSTMALDFMGTGAERGIRGRARVGLVRLGVALLGERMVTLLSEREARRLLADAGWSVVDLSTAHGGLADSFVLAAPTEAG